MARLSSLGRKQVPSADFGIPAKRAYPMPDPAHAANAKARASQQEAKGALAPSTAGKIDAKANKILRKRRVTLGMLGRAM